MKILLIVGIVVIGLLVLIRFAIGRAATDPGVPSSGTYTPEEPASKRPPREPRQRQQ